MTGARSKIIIYYIAIALVGAALFSIPGRAVGNGYRVISRISDQRPRKELPFGKDISAKDLLGLERPARGKLPIQALTVQRVLRICAVRVEFQPDSNTNSTGPGTFNLTAFDSLPENERIIDPPPHDRRYFESHLEALARYWAAVSDSMLLLEYDVYPSSNDGAYRLPDSMAHYGPRSWLGEDLLLRLSEFFKDAWQLVDRADDINYDEYDAFIVFHAGADWQNDVGEYFPDREEAIPSPDDLPTSFIALDAPILNGAINEGIVMPEFASQDGFYTALNSMMAYEFGHQLGLVDLFSTASYVTRIGYFSLMDYGSTIGADLEEVSEIEDTSVSSVYGVLPPFISAWERAYMGFEEPVLLEANAGSLALAACERFSRTDDTTIYKIQINEFEYFLLENRQASLPYNSDVELRKDSLTNVILGPSKPDSSFTAEYDCLLPGSGILIWHVDEAIAYQDFTGDGINNFESNALQWYTNDKFIDLEEAGGPQDLGYIQTYGDDDDYFTRWSYSDFTPDSRPSTESKDSVNTHIYIKNFVGEGERMYFDFSRNYFAEKWLHMTGYPLTQPPVLADLYTSEPNRTEQIILSIGPYILAWDSDGSKIVENFDSLGIIGYTGEIASYPFPIIAEVIDDTALFTTPSCYDLDDDGCQEIIAADDNGYLYAWHPYDSTDDGRADILHTFPRALEGKFEIPPIIMEVDADNSGMEIVLGGSEGKWYVLSDDGNTLYSGDIEGRITGIVPGEEDKMLYILGEKKYGKGKIIKYALDDTVVAEHVLSHGDVSTLVKADLEGDGSFELVCTSDDGYLYCVDQNLTTRPGFPVDFDDTTASDPVVADVDGDGAGEIIFTSADKVYAYSFNGVSITEFPAEFQAAVVISTPPIIHDIDDKGADEILFGTISKGLFAIDSRGEVKDDFPITCGPVIASPAVGELSTTRDGVNLVAGSATGALFVYDILDASNEYTWPMWGLSAMHTNVCAASFDRTITKKNNEIISNLYNYPNPAEDRTTIRYYVNEQAELKLKIFNPVGDIIEEVSDLDATIGEYNELKLNVERYSPGVYVCQIQCNDDEVYYCKIAILK